MPEERARSPGSAPQRLRPTGEGGPRGWEGEGAEPGGGEQRDVEATAAEPGESSRGDGEGKRREAEGPESLLHLDLQKNLVLGFEH